MLKFILGLIVGGLMVGSCLSLNRNPKDLFGTIRTGVDKAEQMQVQQCREEEAGCYLQKSQQECDKLIRQKCG